MYNYKKSNTDQMYEILSPTKLESETKVKHTKNGSIVQISLHYLKLYFTKKVNIVNVACHLIFFFRLRETVESYI